MFGSDSSFIIHRSSFNYGQITHSTATTRRTQDELWAQGADFLCSADHSFLFVRCVGGADRAPVGAGGDIGASASVVSRMKMLPFIEAGYSICNEPYCHNTQFKITAIY